MTKERRSVQRRREILNFGIIVTMFLIASGISEGNGGWKML